MSRSLFISAVLLALVAGCSKEGAKTDAPAASAAQHAAAHVVPGSHDDWCGEPKVPESQGPRFNGSLGRAFKVDPANPTTQERLESLARQMGAYQQLVALYDESIPDIVDDQLIIRLLVKIAQIYEQYAANAVSPELKNRARLGLDGQPRPTAELPTPVQAFIADQAEVQRVAKAEIGDGEEVESWAWSAYRLIQAWDALSLFLCWRGLPDGRERRLPAVPRTLGDPGVDLQLTPLDERTGACLPFPFMGDEAHLPVTARVIPDRLYRSHEDLQAALRDAPTEVRDYRIVPG